ncbi:MAG: factor activating pos9 [Bogoriella megaspora]|nr:MAG: factor activating pos9 [Bogoriella megaspora]
MFKGPSQDHSSLLLFPGVDDTKAGPLRAMRKGPNIIVTGTPGVGKTTHCQELARDSNLRHLSVNEIVKERECHAGWDDELQSWIVDEDKLLDALEIEVKDGGCIIDWHACDLFPKSWIDLVIVIRCNSTVLYDRLVARGYTGKKLDENMDAEIMEVLLEEAREAYDQEIVVELQSDATEDVDSNIERIETWIKQWKKDHADGSVE